MTWTHVVIFWLAVAVAVLLAKNWWLRFSLRVMRDWQARAVGMLARVKQVEDLEERLDDVLDSDVIQ